MSLAGLLCHEVTILRPATTTDRYGDQVATLTGARRWTSPARVVQTDRAENSTGRRVLTAQHETRQARITDWLCYLPAGTDVTALDRIVWNGLTFEVRGVPNRAPDRRSEHHVECDLTRVDG